MALRHEPFEECRCCDKAAADIDLYKREILAASTTVNAGGKTFFVVPEVKAEIERMRDLLNTPETEDFIKAVPLEAAHQVERWAADHDAGKTAWDWFWLIGYLAQKAASAAIAGNPDKAKHHTISTAAALANWHKALSGGDNRMRPGIAPPAA